MNCFVWSWKGVYTKRIVPRVKQVIYTVLCICGQPGEVDRLTVLTSVKVKYNWHHTITLVCVFFLFVCFFVLLVNFNLNCGLKINFNFNFYCFITIFLLIQLQKWKTRGPRATAHSSEWQSRCRYADVMQHFSNPIIATNEWINI